MAGVAGALMFHVVFSVGVALWAGDLLQHRMVNIRHVDARPDLKPDLIASFLRSVGKDPRSKIMIAGSSFSWGYSWPERNTYTFKMQERHPNNLIINASSIGGSIESSHTVICVSDAISQRVDVLVVEYSLPNSVRALGGKKELTCSWTDRDWARHVPYLDVLMRTPFGLGSFHIFWDEYNYSQRDKKFNFNALPGTYFPSRTVFDDREENIRDWLQDIADVGRRIAGKVVVFPAPILREGVAMSQFDPDEIEAMQARLVELCKSIKGVTCLSPPLLEKADYANLTHLNIKGHAVFADWLAGELGLSSGAATP